MILILMISYLFARSEMSADELERATNEYNKIVKPIFEKKCDICHGDKLPKSYIKNERDQKYFEKAVRKSKRSFDSSKGFPFIADGTMQKVLAEVVKEVSKNKMPPKSFLQRHPEMSLTQEEKTIIVDWALLRK